ncbi:hypothetical protein VTN77DRAFT_8120 [Rasamsonia byssochlamydoides]|uniref:uncharacterized protein n=1 Tax=Rasamsonia byssochlamydoides TaxID=89139 RepID=UPI003742491B
MRTHCLVSAALTFAATVSSTAVLLPLYVYPGDDAWNSAYNAIASNPSVPFYVVVNPDNGPGSSDFPDDSFIKGISTLNSYNNVHVLGYVATDYTGLPLSQLTTDIAKYANWANYSPGNISVAGIFFDEATSESSNPSFSYMKDASDFVYSQLFQAAGTSVVFNPGTLAPIEYFSYATFIVEFENSYKQYSALSTPLSIQSQQRSQSAILIYETPVDVDLASLVQEASADGIGAVYLAEDCCYSSLTLVHKIASAIAGS